MIMDNDNDNSINVNDVNIASLCISNTNDATTIATTTSNDTTKVNASSLPFPKDGIRLSSLKDFYDACGGKDKLIGLTTTDVNEKYQKPITATGGLSYCEYLKLMNSPNVGQAVVFISHDVMDAIEWHFRDSPDIIIWFDMFSNNQHKAVDLDFDWWCNTFKSAIKDFGHTVMVFAPWNDPVPLTRGWCLFELYCTITMGATFEVAMSKSHRECFLKDICKSAEDSINMMLATINVEKSECFKEEDKRKIYKIVKDEVGFGEVNSLAFKRMRDWMISTTLLALEVETDNVMKMNLMSGLAGVYNQQGIFDKAQPLYEECLEKRKQILGADHPQTLYSIKNLANLYNRMGKYDKAQPLCEDCLEKMRQINGADHPHTLESMKNLAWLYENMGLYDKAQPLYEECIEKRKQILGADHPHTLSSVLGLGNLYAICMGLYDKAQPLYEECLEKNTQILGADHPDTLGSMYSLATVHWGLGQYDKAQPLYVECLEKRRQILGVDNPDILASMNGLALLYQNMGQYDKAQPLYEECLEKIRHILGEDHPDTLKSLCNIAGLYMNMDQYDKGKFLFEECLEKMKRVLGPDHPNTLIIQNFLNGL